MQHIYTSVSLALIPLLLLEQSGAAMERMSSFKVRRTTDIICSHEFFG